MSWRATLERRLFLLRAREDIPIVLRQRRIFVLPTKAGLLFGVTLLIMLTGAINYNLSLGHALCFVLGSLGLVTLLHTFRNLLGLTITLGRTDAVFAGQTASFGLVLINQRDEPRYGIQAELRGGEVLTVDIPAHGQTLLTLPLPALHRGWLKAGRVTLRSTYPLGLIRAWSYLVPDLICLVYPAPEIGAPPLPGTPGDKGGARALEAGRDDFAGLREYRPSDSPRHIAWKALAAGGPLLTKQFDGEGGIILSLEWQNLPVTLGVEGRLSRLTAWLLEARRLGLSCGLSLPGFQRPPAVGETHFQECLKALALYGEVEEN